LVGKLHSTKGFIPKLSLVAVKDGRTVGHILFSTINIKTDSKSIPVLSLVPMAVLPEY
jgi:putative acetyltransferase